MIERWEGKSFISEGVTYPIVTNIIGQKRIHPELLRQVRKNGIDSKIEPKTLPHEVKRYIHTLNEGFDFITPAHDLENDLIRAEKMSSDFGRGIIHTKALLTNFKGVATKENFMHLTSNQT